MSSAFRSIFVEFCVEFIEIRGIYNCGSRCVTETTAAIVYSTYNGELLLMHEEESSIDSHLFWSNEKRQNAKHLFPHLPCDFHLLVSRFLVCVMMVMIMGMCSVHGDDWFLRHSTVNSQLTQVNHHRKSCKSWNYYIICRFYFNFSAPLLMLLSVAFGASCWQCDAEWKSVLQSLIKQKIFKSFLALFCAYLHMKNHW